MNAIAQFKPIKTMTMKHQKNNGRRRVGALAVEVAMCLPILLMVLFGCYEVARANMLVHATESAAYEGARVGIIPGCNSRKSRSLGNAFPAIGWDSRFPDQRHTGNDRTKHAPNRCRGDRTL